MSNTEKQRVERIVVEWARAVSAGGRREGPWDFFYANPKGPIIYEPTDLRVTAGQDVAFVTCKVHCEGTSAGTLDFRLTVGLEKRDGEWLITHEHRSVPTIEERFIGP